LSESVINILQQQVARGGMGGRGYLTPSF
jgi:hypothetical protein